MSSSWPQLLQQQEKISEPISRNKKQLDSFTAAAAASHLHLRESTASLTTTHKKIKQMYD